MTTLFSQTLKDFINNHAVDNDGRTELVKINTLHTKSQYYSANDVKAHYFEYIMRKYRKNQDLTDRQNNLQAINALNCLYLDMDMHFNDLIDKSSYNRVTRELLDIYYTAWEGVMLDHNIENYYNFQFIPSEYPDGKGGFHVLIICDKNIPMDIRLQMYKTVKENVLDDIIPYAKYFQNTDPNDIRLNYEKIFDDGPIKSKQFILPFAQKNPSSRQYVLRSTTFNYDDPQNYFVIPMAHHEDAIRAESALSSQLDNIMPEFNMDFLNAIEQEEAIIRRDNLKILGPTGKLIGRFMSSLAYLSDKHIFWEKLKNHNDRLNYIIKPLTRFIYMHYFIENCRKPAKDGLEIERSITAFMLPLLRRTLTPGEDTKRATYDSCYAYVHMYCTKYNTSQGLFNDDVLKFWEGYHILSQKERKHLTPEASGHLKAIRNKCRKAMAQWTEFVTKIIIGGITDEIKPFKERKNETDDPRKGLSFEEVSPKQACVRTDIDLEDSFYIRTLRTWIMMFIYVDFYNTNSINEAIRSTLTALTRYFIWYSKTVDGNAKLYLYNIKQTKQLAMYPYNQWIRDSDDGELLLTWLKSIYTNMIRPELMTINKMYGIVPMLDNLQQAGIIDGALCTKMIKPMGNVAKDMDQVFKNIMCSFTQEYWNPPKWLDAADTNFFPMRNGILEWQVGGKAIFHEDNHSRYMDAYTNIRWDAEYNYECEAFQTVNRMWRQIFPVKAEYDYAMLINASTLVGYILKDMLIIQYGTGGDGKTVSNNALLGMLGSDGLKSTTVIDSDGNEEQVENPSGLATTMKTETILVSKASSHDSGGIVQLIGKRFCTVQEPDPNLSGGKLNCARIKEILSGTTVTGREIYQKAEQFKPNPLITLQTNIMLAYTEDTDAMRRRVTVIPYRSKFTTKINSHRYDNLQYRFDADPMLASNFTNNPDYWQALFYVLYPFAQMLVSNGIKAISDIERPESIIDATDNSFAQSNGLVGWINNNIVEKDGHVLRVVTLVAQIREANQRDKNTSGGFLDSVKFRDQCVEIRSQLMGTYMGSIYKLKSEWYNEHKNGLKDCWDGTIEYRRGDTNNSLIETYFEEHAVNSMERSTFINKDDLYIVGYDLKVNDAAI